MKEATLTRRGFVKAASATAVAVGAAGAYKSCFVDVDPALAVDDAGEEKIVYSSCKACVSDCGVKVHMRNGRVLRIEGDPHDPQNGGRICAKGFSAVQALYNPNRMKYPMKRVGERGQNKWERISWKEAIDTIADALTEMNTKGDPMQLVTSTGGGGNPQFYSPVRFACLNGGNFFEPGCAQCFLPRSHGQRIVNGVGPNSIAAGRGQEAFFDDTEMKCLVIWGTDPSQSCVASGGRALANRRAEGVKTVVIDPRFTPDAAKADVWLPIRPGTDVALMLAWINYIIENDLYDHEFCLKWTNLPFLVNEKTKLTYTADELGIGSKDEYVVWDQKTNAPKAMPYPWDDSLEPAMDGEFEVEEGVRSRTAFRALKENCAEWTLEKAAEVCFLDAARIEEAIKIYVEGSPHAGIDLGVATDQARQSAQAAQGSAILEILMSNLEHPGNITSARYTPFLIEMINNFGQFGKHELQMPKEWVERRLGFIEHKGLGAWDASHIPTIREALETGEPYQPKIWLDRSGNKPAMLGGASHFMDAAKNFDLVVHMYMYPTAMSAEAADIILPTAEWLETAYAASRMNTLLLRRDVTHLYEAVDECMIWSWLAKAMAERGNERFAKAFDPDVACVEGTLYHTYWDTYDEYKEFVAWYVSQQAFGGEKIYTWAELDEMLPAEWISWDEYRYKEYDYYAQIDPETGKPYGFAQTMSKKCEPYSDAFVRLARTGHQFGVDQMGYTYPPASVEYPPMPYYLEPSESPLDDHEYPYTVTEGRLPMYHHGTLRNVPYLREIYPVPQTWMNPVTAAEIGVEDGDWVLLESRRGSTHGRALLTEGIAPGVIYQERFWNPELLDSDDPSQAWKAMNVNILTHHDGPYNPEYGTYTLRGFQVKITKSTKPEGVWTEPEDFKPWMPQPTDDTGGGYAVYDA